MIDDVTAEVSIEEFQKLIAANGEPTIKALTNLVSWWRDGTLGADELPELMAVVLMAANVKARTMADGFAAAVLQQAGMTDAESVGIWPEFIDHDAEPDRLVQAAATLVAKLDNHGEQAFESALARLAVSEPTQSAQQQVLTTYLGNGVDGYRRGLNSGACQLCQHLYRGGYVYPSSKPFTRHAGCGCYPIPATKITTTKEKA